MLKEVSHSVFPIRPGYGKGNTGGQKKLRKGGGNATDAEETSLDLEEEKI